MNNEITRREFAQVLGAGLMIVIGTAPVMGQARPGRGGGRRGGSSSASRIHVGTDGIITVFTGKVEMGQGSRAELTVSAAEELRVSPKQVQMLMGDTSLVPNDGVTAGSQTTPSTVPTVRRSAAAAREVLVALACKRLGVEKSAVQVADGKIVHPASGRSISYAELAKNEDIPAAFAGGGDGVSITAVKEWKVMGASVNRPNRQSLVTGEHRFPSDIVQPAMLHGKILRAPTYGARLKSIDLAPAKAMDGVVAVQDGEFVAVAAPTKFLAEQALAAIAKTAQWEPAPHPSSKTIFAYLKQHARGGVPANPFADEMTKAAKALKAEYHVAYVQHAPMEPRAAMAEWKDGKLTVWAGTQNPFGHHSDLVRAFNLPNDNVRVIVPDFGCGFGGKHTGEASVEAARLAKAAGRAVSLVWTRAEEFTWAYFRPAAVIDIEASLDGNGKMTSWYFININSGGAAIDIPYQTGKKRTPFLGSDPPLRQGSYRALAATANNFARECFMDELATAAGADPLEFRLKHLDNPRLRAVLETAAKRFNWTEKSKKKDGKTGVGLACGTEKGSYVATCAEIAVDRDAGEIQVKRVCEVFECGAIVNPNNLWAQVAGCIIMGLGPALREEMKFEGGKMLNGSFADCQVPRMADVPELDIELLNRPDIEPIGGGETPIIGIAPAIANALFHAIGVRCRSMPVRVPA